MNKLNPDALAEWSDEEGRPASDIRPGVQPNVTPHMITAYVLELGALPRESAEPFSEYLHRMWNDYVESEDIKQKDLVAGALEYWRGR